MFFWNSLAFSMIQQMLAIWFLVPLPFLKPAWTSGSSSFTYCLSLAAAAAAKSRQSCPTLCDPMDSSPPGSSIHGISRQEYWSELPFSSPMHESEKWMWSCSVMSDSQRTHGLQPTRLLHPWDFPGKSTGVECHCLLRTCCYLIKFPHILYWVKMEN